MLIVLYVFTAGQERKTFISEKNKKSIGVHWWESWGTGSWG